MFCFVLFFDVYMSSKLHGWRGEAVREEGLNGVCFFVMGSKDKIFPMYGCIHSHSNRVNWWTNNEDIPSQRKGSTRVGIPTFTPTTIL